MKSPGSPFREVYLERRKHTETTHPDWPKWKSHKDGLRITSKAILKSLWLEARRLNEGASVSRTDDQYGDDAPSTISKGGNS